MNLFNKYLKNDLGVAAIIFAFSIPMIIGSAGVGVDLAKAYHTKNKLEKTLDAAVLAGASSRKTGTDLENFIKEYVKANFRETDDSLINIDSLTVTENTTEKTIEVKANAVSNNTFMPFFGKDDIIISADAMSKKKLTGVEVALVLDDSESMKFNNKSNDLESAAKNFIDVLYDTAADTGGEFKIGIVPYGSFVNVGPYGIGKDLSGGSYNGGVGFVNNPKGLNYTNSRNQKEDAPNWAWSGCVLEHDFYNSGSHSPQWDMYFFCHDENGTRIDAGHPQPWNNECRFGENQGTGYWDPAPTVVYGPWYDCPKTVDGETYICKKCCRTSTTTNPGKWVSTTPTWVENKVNIHKYCPNTIIRPLISNTEAGGRGTLKSDISQLSGANGARTYSNLGMIWAYELLSPEEPFTEGAEWGSSKWSKVIVFMTDGNIQADRYFGPYYPIDVDKESARTNRTKTRFTEACNTAKAKGILVYTVQFEGGTPLNAADQAVLEACASDPSKALRASSGADLYEAFKNIAEDLGNIYLYK